jgi:hypothetical protein
MTRPKKVQGETAMTKTLKSFTSSARYFLTIDDETGKATNCTCPDHSTWRPNRPGGCKHMQSFNQEMTRTETFRQLWHALDVRSEAGRAARREAYCIEFGIYA